MNKENLVLEEQVHELKHLLKILAKGQEQIKSHLWRQPKNDPHHKEPEELELQKREAINYINDVVVPEIEAHQAERGEIGVQGLQDWFIAQLAQPLVNWLKNKALEYISEALSELKNKAIPLAVEVADWALDQLENIVVEQYNKANEGDKEAFKNSIKEHFPNSRLLEKL